MNAKAGLLARLLWLGVLLLASAPARAQTAAVPDDTGILILVRTSIVALNHANRTGNYTVLRDLGAPGFRQANDAARLSQIFARLRARDIDLAPVVAIEPLLRNKPFIDKRGLLRVTGQFPARPLRLEFDLAYQHADGRWRLFGVSVNPVPSVAQGPAGNADDGPARR